jgi:hypothetical protein
MGSEAAGGAGRSPLYASTSSCQDSAALNLLSMALNSSFPILRPLDAAWRKINIAICRLTIGFLKDSNDCKDFSGLTTFEECGLPVYFISSAMPWISPRSKWFLLQFRLQWCGTSRKVVHSRRSPCTYGATLGKTTCFLVSDLKDGRSAKDSFLLKRSYEDKHDILKHSVAGCLLGLVSGRRPHSVPHSSRHSDQHD